MTASYIREGSVEKQGAKGHVRKTSCEGGAIVERVVLSALGEFDLHEHRQSHAHYDWRSRIDGWRTCVSNALISLHLSMVASSSLGKLMDAMLGLLAMGKDGAGKSNGNRSNYWTSYKRVRLLCGRPPVGAHLSHSFQCKGRHTGSFGGAEFRRGVQGLDSNPGSRSACRWWGIQGYRGPAASGWLGWAEQNIIGMAVNIAVVTRNP